MEQQTKTCKYCQSEIPKKARICPNCRKKQGGIGKWVVIVIVFLVLVSAMFGGGGETPPVTKTGEVDTSKEISKDESNTVANDTEETEESVSNIFNVGDIVETDNLQITFVSSSSYTPDNEYLVPKDGYEYWEFEFKFENISDTDQNVSSMMDWECYADNSKVDQAWISDDNGLDATLSSGRTTQGKIYFEVPTDATSIELEYDINFWQSDKIIFVGK